MRLVGDNRADGRSSAVKAAARLRLVVPIQKDVREVDNRVCARRRGYESEEAELTIRKDERSSKEENIVNTSAIGPQQCKKGTKKVL